MTTPAEKLETMSDIVGGRWYLQRWDDGLYGCGIGALGEFDVRDQATAEDAVDEVARRLELWLVARITATRQERDRLAAGIETLERLGY